MKNSEVSVLIKKLSFFAENLLRLLDQSGYWANQYVGFRFKSKHVEAEQVKEKYLDALDRKIRALVVRWFLEL